MAVLSLVKSWLWILNVPFKPKRRVERGVLVRICFADNARRETDTGRFAECPRYYRRPPARTIQSSSSRKTAGPKATR